MDTKAKLSLDKFKALSRDERMEYIRSKESDVRGAESAGLEVRHDMHGYYVLTVEECDREDHGKASVGFDGRPHCADIESAWQAAAEKARE